MYYLYQEGEKPLAKTQRNDLLVVHLRWCSVANLALKQAGLVLAAGVFEIVLCLPYFARCLGVDRGALAYLLWKGFLASLHSNPVWLQVGHI